MAKPDLHNSWLQIKQSVTMPSLWVAMLLIIANWGIEARKWQWLLSPLERMPFAIAFKSILVGCSITMLTPNRVGEYGGRILYVSPHNRLAAIPLTILGSMSQLFITAIMGTAGLLYFKIINQPIQFFSFLPNYTANIFLLISSSLAIILLLLYLRIGNLVKYLQQINFLKTFVVHLLTLNTFSRKELLRILFLSFFRYLVFILQFILLLYTMQVHIPIVPCFALLTLFYLVMALAPTIGFMELPIRAAASLQLLQAYSNNVVGIQVAALGIWLINLVIPAIVGSLLLLSIKILKDK